MRSFKMLPAAVALCVVPLANAQQPLSPTAAVDRIVAQEQAEVGLLRQYAPLVETYIQYLRPDKQLGAVPDGDKYFLGRADLAKGVDLEPLDRDSGMKHKVFGSWGTFFSKAASHSGPPRPARLGNPTKALTHS